MLITLLAMLRFSLLIYSYIFFRLLKFKEVGPKPEVGVERPLSNDFLFITSPFTLFKEPLLDDRDNFFEFVLNLKTVEVHRLRCRLRKVVSDIKGRSIILIIFFSND